MVSILGVVIMNLGIYSVFARLDISGRASGFERPQITGLWNPETSLSEVRWIGLSASIAAAQYRCLNNHKYYVEIYFWQRRL